MFRSRVAATLMLIVLASGVNANDWMSMVEPKEYFKARNINPTIDRMIDLAIADIDSPRAQIRQLAALKHLTSIADEFKKTKNYQSNREAIEEVADGKRGRDPSGFGQEYAKRLLAKLDEKKIAAAKPVPLRKDALHWFPSDVKLALALDTNQLQEITTETSKAILKSLSGASRSSFYDQLESIGNVRMDRMEFGVVDAEKWEDQKSFTRFSGQANQAWIANVINQRSPGLFEIKKFKDKDGTPMIALHGQQGIGTVIVLVGNTDMVVLSCFGAKSEDLVAEFQAVRAKKKPHAGEGALKDRLARIPDKAIGFLVGDLVKELREEFGAKLDPLPANISAYLERGPMGFDVKMEAAMKDAAEANKLVKKVSELRKAGIEELQKVQKQPPLGMPLLPYPSLIKLLETVQVQNKDARVELAAFVSNGLVQQLGEMIVSSSRDSQDPPPVLKDKK